MQEFHNEDHDFSLYFLLFFVQNLLEMNGKQHEETAGVFRRVFKCNNKQFVFNRRNL